ncbi:serine hydrolase domain-containing protein [Flagellimonas allohymeniacidonis]|uniref:Class A beta-lactamase-related serine hydrolase n=1 Tax=Flagellimonas allohymeniacidonis TaxID=2517819 RepID=A0A4Q8QEG1_9FLAO|nr:serine hydrolase domain-containing protein [Allomuricauda hymeniacidonis]TAI48892.1 class A beta-lactamase-related serine hydrolase [Allomuricauda hymeniacidonis]
MGRLVILLIPFLLFISCNILDQNKNQKAVEYLEQEMEQQGIPGLQAIVIQKNEIVLSENLGFANVPFSIRTQENTIFSINSIAKVFAATAIMQLVEKGKFQISEPISMHIDGLPDDWSEITIEQLLSHTSGLPDIEDPNTEGLIGGKGPDSAWVKVRKMPLQFKAGAKFNYNATNYLLIQKLIEKYGESSFEAFVKKNQFDIAQMHKTVFGNSFDVVENKSPTYSYYLMDKAIGDYVKGDQLLEVSEEFPSMLRADAGAFSSAHEMAKWVLALQSGKFLQNNTSIEKMWQAVQLDDGSYGGFGDIFNGYGLGWPVVNRENHPAVLPIGGGRAAFAIYPEDKLTIILFTNLSGVLVHEIVESLSKIYLDNTDSSPYWTTPH